MTAAITLLLARLDLTHSLYIYQSYHNPLPKSFDFEGYAHNYAKIMTFTKDLTRTL